MKALLINRICQMTAMHKSIFITYALMSVYLVYTTIQISSTDMLMTFGAMFAALTGISYGGFRLAEHNEGWQKYTHTMPISKKDLVNGEFVCMISLVIGSLLYLVCLLIIVTLVGVPTTTSNLFFYLSFIPSLSMMIQALAYVFSLKFGVEKSTEAAMLSIVTVTPIMTIVGLLVNNGDMPLVERLPWVYVLVILSITAVFSSGCYRKSLALIEDLEF